MKPILDRFLKYAHTVVSAHGCPNPDHWPGYLGPQYGIGRVLLVGMIHSSVGLDRTAGPMAKLTAEQHRWAHALRWPSSDQRYVETMREVYPMAAPSWADGPVWRNFYKILAALNLRLEQVAFTNLAKCSWKSGDRELNRVVRRCRARFPLQQLVEAIEPLAVFIATRTPETHALAEKLQTSQRRVWVYGNRDGRDLENRLLREWLPEAVEDYKARLRVS